MVKLCRKFREVTEQYRGSDGTPLAHCIREKLAGKPWLVGTPGDTVYDWSEADLRSMDHSPRAGK